MSCQSTWQRSRESVNNELVDMADELLVDVAEEPRVDVGEKPRESTQERSWQERSREIYPRRQL
jgi:hypothetical protein